MTDQAKLLTIVERPEAITALANLVREFHANLTDIENSFKAGLYVDTEAYTEDHDDANDQHIIALIAYQAAWQLMKSRQINETQQHALEVALSMEGIL